MRNAYFRQTYYELHCDQSVEVCESLEDIVKIFKCTFYFYLNLLFIRCLVNDEFELIWNEAVIT
jgi:hypothetical protein